MFLDLGTCVGLWRLLRSVGTRMGECWLGHLQKSESTVRVFQVFECENMTVPVHKNRATSRRSRELYFQRRDVLEDKFSNVATF